MRSLLLVSFLILKITVLPAQEKCATNNIKANIELAKQDQFESWLQNKVLLKRAQQTAHTNRTSQESIYEIPVVFQVVHDGSEIGSGSNLATEKILQQIDILNADFRRLNSDTVNTPSQFLDVAADTKIKFVLAKQDPEGMPTDGIVRIRGSKDTYNPNYDSDDILIKSETSWPQDKYLNIYITDLSSGNLGYAQYPFSDLPGIASEMKNYASTDGVVIDYNWIGDNTKTGAFDSYGRTATHEIGHYLGLRHTWGDGGCDVDDFCADTPDQSGATTGCPSNKITCGSLDMIQNYMDYTDDRCMNLFTECQKGRMRTVLEFSPRRKSLLSSPGLQEPVLASNDIGVRNIIAPRQSDCNFAFSPGVQVRNYGSNLVTSFKINLKINGISTETQTISTYLESGETTEVIFSPVTENNQVSNIFTFSILAVNNTTDGKNSNNEKSINIEPVKPANIPYFQGFQQPVNLITSTENGNPSMWRTTGAPDSSASNQAAFLPFYDQKANFGYRDRLITPTLDLSALTSAKLDFSYAYAARLSPYLDGLVIAVSTDCGETFPRENIIFEAYGTQLPTSNSTDFSFVPTDQYDWENLSLNITRFAGYEHVRIAFMGVNGGGNNIYLDNISLSSADLSPVDLRIKSVSDVPTVSCDPITRPKIEVKNYGYEDATSLSIHYSLNNIEDSSIIKDLKIRSGETESFYLSPKNNLTNGNNELAIRIAKVNGVNNTVSSNSSANIYAYLSNDSEVIPVQETFDSLSWTIADPTGESFYKISKIVDNSVLVTNSFDNALSGKSYLVSPTIETKNYSNAAVRFDYSYAQRPGYNDNLKVLLSVNCGMTFDYELLSLNSEQMAVTSSGAEWVPNADSLWKQAFIDISEYMSWSEIRVALVFSNGNGNRLYLDNINVLTTNDPSLPEFIDPVKVYPNPADAEFNMAFNLKEKKHVRIQVFDLSGRTVFDQTYGNIINQTLNMIAPSQRGFYLVYVSGEGLLYKQKIFIR